MVFVFPIFLVFVSVAALDNLCSSDAFENKCLCKTFTNELTDLPGLMANCKGLSIHKFPEFSQFPDDLSVLDLSMNNIEALESSNAISSNSLTKLILSYNIINDVTVDFFKGIPALNWLDLSHNNLSSLSGNGDIFLQQKNLLYLDLSYNNIKQLPGAIFEPMHIQKFLDLSYNPLGEFLMGSKDVLYRTLGVSPNITHFKLNNVGLRDLHPDYFRPFQSLKHLELKDNYLNFIPTMPYSVEYLDFSGNNLSFVSARYLNYHSLRFLRLSRMPSLISIHHYAFYNLQSLETLIITDCPNVTEFTDLAFGLASKNMDIHPKALILARNGITTLNSMYAHMFRNMQHIDLTHNPWTCNCDILWLQEFGADLFENGDVRCTSPRRLKKRRLLDLTHLDLPDCFPDVYGKVSHRITIVVLMTTVIFLVGLIFFLMRYPKCWVNPRHIGVGPNSPYNIAPQEDVRY